MIQRAARRSVQGRQEDFIAMAARDFRSNAIDDVVKILARSNNLLFITGAGISADSGLPTYRGIGGLYDGEHPEEGIPIEEILSGEMMRARPELTWKYLGHIEQAARGAKFNRGHEVIAEMESRFARVWTLTQNIDGFHRAADAKNVLEIHGSMHELSCTACGFRQHVEDYAGLSIPPHCPKCRMILRPDVVLFGEQLPSQVLDKFYEEMDRGFDVVFSIGTTSVFPYIAGPVQMAARRGWFTVEINPGESAVSHLVDVRLPLGAAVALDAIWRGCQRLDG
jgi:NAD-dependent deacetylase